MPAPRQREGRAVAAGCRFHPVLTDPESGLLSPGRPELGGPHQARWAVPGSPGLPRLLPLSKLSNTQARSSSSLVAAARQRSDAAPSSGRFRRTALSVPGAASVHPRFLPPAPQASVTRPSAASGMGFPRVPLRAPPNGTPLPSRPQATAPAQTGSEVQLYFKQNRGTCQGDPTVHLAHRCPNLAPPPSWGSSEGPVHTVPWRLL